MAGGFGAVSLVTAQCHDDRRFPAGEADRRNVAHVAVEVDVNANALEALVTERGWDVVFPLNRELFGARGMGAGTYIRDPEGNVIELRTYAT